MHFEIMNVGYASCALLQADNGNVALFDCGGTSTGTRPHRRLRELGAREVSWLAVLNYDEDHISDLPALRQSFPIRILQRNRSVSTESLRQMKLRTGPLSTAMAELLQMTDSYTGSIAQTPAFPRASWEVFCNSYPTFEDTNNLSLVVFLNVGGLRVVLPGDVAAAGWRELLKNSRFCEYLAASSVFVASHHGREDGYCPEVFEHCRPNVVVISDGPIRYATQGMIDTYARHATGVVFGGRTRKVFTTRCDDSISWTR